MSNRINPSEETFIAEVIVDTRHMTQEERDDAARMALTYVLNQCLALAIKERDEAQAQDGTNPSEGQSS